MCVRACDLFTVRESVVLRGLKVLSVLFARVVSGRSVSGLRGF